MDQNQYQPRRTDYQSMPVARRQIMVNDGSTEVGSTVTSAPTVTVVPTPVVTPPAMDLLEPGISNQSAGLLEPDWDETLHQIGYAPLVPDLQPQPVTVDPTVPVSRPISPEQDVAPSGLATAQPTFVETPINPEAIPQVAASDVPIVAAQAPAETDAPARPYQITTPKAVKPALWKTQKFWLISVGSFFVLLVLVGAFIGYKATHHKADKKLPVSAVTAVDTSSDVKAVGATSGEQTANEQRQKSILALRSFLETYYMSKVMYPTTVQMVDASWVLTNLKGVTNENLKDPDGTIVGLTTMPTKGRYAYQAARDNSMESCDNVTQNCNYFKLTAILTDGSEYSKTALH